MDIHEYVRQTHDRLVADDYEISEVPVSGGTALVVYHGKWKATVSLTHIANAAKLHFFIVVLPVETATAGDLHALTDDAYHYARRSKGLFQGVESGLMVVPALVAEHVAPDARALAEERPKREFAALIQPVVVDLAAGETYSYTGTIVWGVMYADFIRDRVRTAFPAPQPARG